MSDVDHVLVTFLYRCNEATRNVAIIGGFTVAWEPETRFAAGQTMTQLAHANIWYKTLKVGRGSPRLPVRFYVEVGSLQDYPAPDHPSQLIANRDLRNVLKEKGYAIRYVEFDGRHEFVNWEALFPEALTFLLGARNAKRGAH